MTEVWAKGYDPLAGPERLGEGGASLSPRRLFPLQTLKEQARERRADSILTRFGGNTKYIFHLSRPPTPPGWSQAQINARPESSFTF
jgi:hypothetical protein